METGRLPVQMAVVASCQALRLCLRSVLRLVVVDVQPGLEVLEHDRGSSARPDLWVGGCFGSRSALGVLEACSSASPLPASGSPPGAAGGLGALAGLVLVAYGWLMWTRWCSWRSSSARPHSVAHWLASIHVLPHNHAAGVAVMAVGGLIFVAVVGWVAVDLVPGSGGALPTHGRYEFTGITTQARFAYGKTAAHHRRAPGGDRVAVAHGRRHPVDPHDPGRDLRAACNRAQRRSRLRRPARPRLRRLLGHRGLHHGLLHGRTAHPTALHPQPLLGHPLRHRRRDARRRAARDTRRCGCGATTSPS